MEWSTACLDWEDRIVRGESIITCPVLFPEVAHHSVENIFKRLKIVDMVGRPTIGSVCKPWIFDFANVFFGGLDDINNVRHINEIFLLISKKNTKSTTAAGIVITVLITNIRESAEFLTLAPTKTAADNVFKPVKDMIRADEDLLEIFHVQEHIRTITHRETRATMKVVAADSDTVSGSKATGVLIDELWAFGSKPKARTILTEATGGLMSRPEGFVMYLTTQSDEPPAGIYLEKLLYARAVRDGKIKDPHFLPVLYEFPKKMLEDGSYKDPENWYITNPNLGASVDIEFLKRKLATAEQGGEESLQEVHAKHLNIEIGVRLASNRWSGAEFWEECAFSEINIDYLLENSDAITIGIDGGGLDDLLGLCVLGRHRETKTWMAWFHAWAHPSVLKRRKEIKDRLKDFEKDGNLTIVKKIGDDIEQLVDIVMQVDSSDLLFKIGVDPHMIGDILDKLEERELDPEKIVGVSQGWKLVAPIKTSERKLAEKALIHSGAKLMNWCVGNAKIEPRGNAVLITKQVSGSAKIDPLMAMFNAVHIMSLNPRPMTQKFKLLIM